MQCIYPQPCIMHCKTISLRKAIVSIRPRMWHFLRPSVRRNIAHMVVSMGVIRAPGIVWTPELSKNRTVSPQNKFIGVVLVCRYSPLWSFAHQAHMGLPMSVIIALGILWTMELSNHRAELLLIKFIGTVLVCRCAWSFAHWGHMDVHTGVISALVTSFRRGSVIC